LSAFLQLFFVRRFNAQEPAPFNARLKAVTKAALIIGAGDVTAGAIAKHLRASIALRASTAGAQCRST
jgi:hypothetical protein